jgi:hypothetical protein
MVESTHAAYIMEGDFNTEKYFSVNDIDKFSLEFLREFRMGMPLLWKAWIVSEADCQNGIPYVTPLSTARRARYVEKGSISRDEMYKRETRRQKETREEISNFSNLVMHEVYTTPLEVYDKKLDDHQEFIAAIAALRESKMLEELESRKVQKLALKEELRRVTPEESTVSNSEHVSIDDGHDDDDEEQEQEEE